MALENVGTKLTASATDAAIQQLIFFSFFILSPYIRLEPVRVSPIQRFILNSFVPSMKFVDTD
jgi:hypothetical protein